jgi:hypothetical protein
VKQVKKDEIYDRLQGKPHLRPIFSSVLSIPERVKEHNKDFFVVFNTEKQWYEVHSLANIGDTFCMNIPLNELDSRVLRLVRKQNIRVRGKKVIDEMLEHNARLEKSNINTRRDELEQVAKYIQPQVKKMAYNR